MTNINLTAPPIDRDLTAPERIPSDVFVTTIIGGGYRRVTRSGDVRVTRSGDTRVTRDIYTAYPPLLTAQPIDRDLTAPERY